MKLRLTLVMGACILSGSAAWAQNEPPVAQLVINADQPQAVIDRNIYGHFSEHLGHCIYGGVWVGEDSPIPNTRGIRNDVVAALKQIKIPVLRWPGGCFADEYHWRDGIGPRQNRPSMINTHWGGVVENNHFGTHEFLDFCAQLGCQPYICGNLGSGEVKEMSEWVEYVNFDGLSPMSGLRKANGREQPWGVKYFGVGNENWGCGGNMTPEFYADQYKRYATYVRSYGTNRIFKIACGPNSGDFNWTEVMMKEAGKRMDGLALHYYCGSGRTRKPAREFEEEDWFVLLRSALRMEELVTRNCEIMDKYDPQKRVALVVDEWGTWHAVEPGTNPGFLYQQNTLRDALVAGVTLNIFNNHSDRVRMANIAQTINVLQAMILTDKEKMTVTPTYHVYEMYTVHHDARRLPCELEAPNYTSGTNAIPGVSVSASRAKDGKLHVTLCNLNPRTSVSVNGAIRGVKPGAISGRVLTAEDMHAHNTFENPQAVQPGAFLNCRVNEGGFTAKLPAKSVVSLELE